ncbi:ZIP family metal transporter [Patescibacteria group bacterium]|nr:ZIP family metal transporter [Patescibacteria group bacterium]
MSTFIYIIIASIIESLVALTGILFLFIGYKKFKKYLPNLISFSVGTFLAVVFFELIPESVEIIGIDSASMYILAGFLFFFIFSKVLHWYHHHDGDCCDDEQIKSSGYLVLAGDFIHNFIDGIIIALAFMADFNIGIATTAAVLFHEFPQEASDFFVMVHAGFSKGRALFFNFLVSLSTIIGAVLTYFLANKMDGLIGPALAIVAGNFLYISASDLLPELTKDKKTLPLQVALILLGIIVIYLATGLIHE